MIQLEHLIQLKFIEHICSSCLSYWNYTVHYCSSDSSQLYLNQQYPPPSWQPAVYKMCHRYCTRCHAALDAYMLPQMPYMCATHTIQFAANTIQNSLPQPPCMLQHTSIMGHRGTSVMTPSGSCHASVLGPGLPEVGLPLRERKRVVTMAITITIPINDKCQLNISNSNKRVNARWNQAVKAWKKLT